MTFFHMIILLLLKHVALLYVPKAQSVFAVCVKEHIFNIYLAVTTIYCTYGVWGGPGFLNIIWCYYSAISIA